MSIIKGVFLLHVVLCCSFSVLYNCKTKTSKTTTATNRPLELPC